MKEFLFILLLVFGPILINGEGLLPMYQTGSVKNFQSYKKTFAKIQITNALRYRSNNMDRAKYIWEEFKGKFTNEDWLVMDSVISESLKEVFFQIFPNYRSDHLLSLLIYGCYLLFVRLDVETQLTIHCQI